MSSFLKRITPASQIGNHGRKSNAHIAFEIDEPYFLLKRKFNALLDSPSAKANHASRSNILFCPKCGNTEFSHLASYCKICGHQVYQRY